MSSLEWRILAFVLFISQTAWVECNYFCHFPCGKQHTVCRRRNCGVGKECGPGGMALSLNDEERQHILDLHNVRRNMIALGQDTRGGNSEAANMCALSYEKEIEFVAQCHSNSCPEISNAHDKCRSVLNFEFVGQNMFWIELPHTEDPRHPKFLNAAVDAWYNEIKHSTASEIDKYTGAKPIGHFTQVVWAETTHIGCARTSYRDSKMFYLYIYCNYGTTGNVVGASVYQRGKPCSKCDDEEECNSKYEGLCGDILEPEHDTWQLPEDITNYASQRNPTTIIVVIAVLLMEKLF